MGRRGEDKETQFRSEIFPNNMFILFTCKFLLKKTIDKLGPPNTSARELIMNFLNIVYIVEKTSLVVG